MLRVFENSETGLLWKLLQVLVDLPLWTLVHSYEDAAGFAGLDIQLLGELQDGSADLK